VIRYEPIPGGQFFSAVIGGLSVLMLAALILRKDLRALASL